MSFIGGNSQNLQQKLNCNNILRVTMKLKMEYTFCYKARMTCFKHSTWHFKRYHLEKSFKKSSLMPLKVV